MLYVNIILVYLFLTIRLLLSILVCHYHPLPDLKVMSPSESVGLVYHNQQVNKEKNGDNAVVYACHHWRGSSPPLGHPMKNKANPNPKNSGQ